MMNGVNVALRAIRGEANKDDVFVPGKSPEAFGLKVTVVDVGPELAAVWLGQNVGNRNPKPTAVDKYGRDMLAGQWLLTGEPIIFDSGGVLRNGQNRLFACARTGATFTSLVVWGVDPGSFAEMDRNVPRTIADVLKIAGVSDSTRRVAVLHYIWREANFGTLRAGGKRVFTVAEAQSMLEQYPEIVECLDWYGPLSKAFLKPAAIGPYLFWRLSRINATKAEEFFRAIAYGENLKVGDAVHSLREVLAAGAVNKARRSEYDQDHIKWLVMTAWRYYGTGKQATPTALRKAAIKLGEEVASGAMKFTAKP